MAEDLRDDRSDNVDVRDEAAGSPYRGTIWALVSIAAFVLIAALVLFGYVLRSTTNNKPNETPAQIEQKRQ